MKYAYIICCVSPVKPEQVSLSNSIVEQATGTPVPDIISAVHPSSMAFKHCVVEAYDLDDAYDKGARKLNFGQNGGVCNDYAFKIR